MFHSQKINTDPRPYYIAEDDSRRTVVEIEADGGDERFPNGGLLYNLAKFDPRPEFDNNPNPILIDFRRFIAGRGETASSRSAAVYLAALVDPDVENEATHSLDRLYEEPYRYSERQAQEAHARKVLQRLARLAEKSRSYDSYTDLVAAEANGFAVAVMLSRYNPTNGRRTYFVRTGGPYADKVEAGNAARRIRGQVKTAIRNDPHLRLHGIHVEPLWKDLNFKVKGSRS